MIHRATNGLCLLGAAILASAFFFTTPIRPAHAQACDPVAADNVDATCSGGVITQNGTIGYGGLFDNVSVNVLSDATVLGPAVGILLDDNITIDNAGSIVGVFNDGIDVLTLTRLSNSGLIQGFDTGVLANLIQSMDNAGTIIALGNGVNAALIQGLTNTGTIASVFANGIIANSILNLSNFGTIGGSDEGIEANFIGTLFNAGTIESPFSDAIDVDGELVSLINTGLIQGGSQGVDIGFGTVVNSGIIKGNAAIEVDRIAQGNAFVINSGSILSNAGPGGIAIDFQGFGNDGLTLLPGSVIVGAINLGAGTDKLEVGNGLSIAKTFDSTPEIIETNGAPFAVNGNQVAVVDPTLEAFQDEILTDLTNGIFGGVSARLNGLPGNSVVGVTQPPGTYDGAMRLSPRASYKGTQIPSSGDRQSWAHAFGAARNQDAARPTVEADHQLGGLMSGMDGQVSAYTRAGFFLGGSWGEADTAFNSQEEEIETFFGGVYARHTMRQLAVDMAFTVGHSAHERDRQVANNLVATGLQTASSEFDGVFTSAELGLSRQVPLGAHFVVPSVQVRYAGHFLDGFTEQGAAGNLSVADRDIHLFQGRGQVALPLTRQTRRGGVLRGEVKVGIEGRTNVGDDAFGAVLLGQQISFVPGGTDSVVSFFGGTSISFTLPNDRVQFYAGADGGLENDGSSYVAGRAGAKVRF